MSHRLAQITIYKIRSATNYKILAQVAQWVKNPSANEGEVSSIPGLGRSPGEGNGYSLQYPCLGNPMDRVPWWAMVHRVAKELDTT